MQFWGAAALTGVPFPLGFTLTQRTDPLMPKHATKKADLLRTAAAPQRSPQLHAPAPQAQPLAKRRALARGSDGRFEGSRRITEEDVEEIHRRARLGHSDGQIAKKLGISRPSVSHIRTGRRRAKQTLTDAPSGFETSSEPLDPTRPS